MVKISEVHPTLVHSMETTLKILNAAIELREKEIANMRACVLACHKVMVDEILPADEHSAKLQTELAARLDSAVNGKTNLQKAMVRVDAADNRIPNR